ncbi:hypothetical protein ASE09_32265 [Streptomyces sp. Root66D1]|nr:hypothetical protein ASE09_32265 [Streptomyces sp. Root66D1]
MRVEMRLRWEERMPLGRPVDPDVNITHATSSKVTTVSGSLVGRAPIASASRSTRTVCHGPVSRPACRPSLTSTAIRASDAVFASRSSGNSGSRRA